LKELAQADDYLDKGDRDQPASGKQRIIIQLSNCRPRDRARAKIGYLIKGIEVMNTRILFPAIASLALLAGGPALALPPAGAIDGVRIERATPVVALASAVQRKAHCRKYANYHERSRCREIHGIPDTVN
jgi:hypothetical protein